MLKLDDLTNRGLSVFSYHEDGVSRAWLVHQIILDLESGKLRAPGVMSPILWSTAEALYDSGGLDVDRMHRLRENHDQLCKPGILLTSASLNDGNPIIMDGRHRYVTLALMFRGKQPPEMPFYTLRDDELEQYEIEVPRALSPS